MAAVLAALFFALTGRPVEAERWADVVDRWQQGDTTQPYAPYAEAHAAILRALMCRRGVKQIHVDADEAVRRCAAESIVTPAPALYQGLARVLSDDLAGADASFEDAVSAGEQAGAHETLAVTLCERSLVAMARSQWSRAEALADQARTVLRRAGIEESYAMPLVCAVRAWAALHRGDVPAARQELISAQRLRHLLTYAGGLAAISLWWHDTPAIHGLGDWLMNAGRITGLAAGYGVVVLVALMARLPPLERGIGADRLARWHAMGGRYIVSLVVAHALLITWGYAVTAHTSVVSQTRTLLVSYPDVIAATFGGLLLVGVGISSARPRAGACAMRPGTTCTSTPTWRSRWRSVTSCRR